MSEQRCQHADAVAAYALGALDADERGVFEAHLGDCPSCRDELASLCHVVDALPASVPPAQPPAALRDRLMATVRAEAEVLRAAGPEADGPARVRARRAARGPWRRRPLALAGATAALALAVLGGFGLRAATEGGGGGEGRTVQAQVTTPGGAAFVVLRSGAATLRVRGLPAPPRGYVYEVWLVRRGVAAPAPTDALFSVDHRGRGRVALPSVRGVTTVLVTAEPDGGSQAPTSKPLISAPL